MTDNTGARIQRIAAWLEPFFHQPDREISGADEQRIFHPGFYEALPPHADAEVGDLVRTPDGAYVATADDWVLIGSVELTEAEIIAALGYTPADGADIGPILADIVALEAHAVSTANPHGVTKAQVGLGNVDNTSDATKNSAVATLTNKTLTTPTISATGFTNATHAHAAANSGGQLDHTAALTNVGTNTHAQIDTHLAATAAHGATGAVVGTTNTQTLSGKTLTTPTISATGFTNANHAHLAANSGGTLTKAAISDFAHTHAPTVTIRECSTTVANNAVIGLNCSCVAGEVAVGGGGGFSDAASASLHVSASHPNSATSWRATGSNNGSGVTRNFYTYVVCLVTPI